MVFLHIQYYTPYLYVSLPGITTHTILYTNTCMLVYLVLLHIQYYTPIPVCQSTWYYTYTYAILLVYQYLYVSLPGITTHTILCTNTCMLVYLVLLHIQYYAPIPVCYSTWYYYTQNTKHQYLYVSLPGINTHTIVCTNICMLVYLVLLHIQYYTPIPVCQSTWYYYTYNTIHQYLYASLPGITTHAIYTPIPICQSNWYYYTYNTIHQYMYVIYLVVLHIQYYTPIPVCQSTWYYYTYNTINHACMLVYLVLLHIQYYAPIPVCQSTWYYYTYNTMHKYLYISLPGINTHTIIYSNTCMLVYLVLLHLQYYTPIPVY